MQVTPSRRPGRAPAFAEHAAREAVRRFEQAVEGAREEAGALLLRRCVCARASAAPQRHGHAAEHAATRLVPAAALSRPDTFVQRRRARKSHFPANSPRRPRPPPPEPAAAPPPQQPKQLIPRKKLRFVLPMLQQRVEYITRFRKTPFENGLPSSTYPTAFRYVMWCQLLVSQVVRFASIK